jgi:hypothetical protein
MRLREHVDRAEASTSKDVDIEVEEFALYVRLAKGAIAEAAFRRNMRLQGRRA